MKMMDEKAIELNYLDNGLGLSEYKSCKEASTLFVRSAMLFAASKKGFKPFKKELKSISVLLEKNSYLQSVLSQESIIISVFTSIQTLQYSTVVSPLIMSLLLKRTFL